MFYASLFEFLSFLLCLCLGFANVLCLFIYNFLLCCVSGLVLPNVLCLFIFIFYFVSVSLFRQCAVPLYLYFFFYACGSILQMFYASSFIFFFSLVPVAWFRPCTMPLHLYLSFLLCLSLGFDNVICLFIDIFSFYASVSWFCHCSVPLF